MDSITYQVDVPASIQHFGLNQKEVQRRLNEWLVLSLFSESKISSGKAARLLNISRIDFLDLLRERGVAYVNLDESELDDEISTALGIEPKQS